jgi:hypothetical protein
VAHADTAELWLPRHAKSGEGCWSSGPRGYIEGWGEKKGAAVGSREDRGEEGGGIRRSKKGGWEGEWRENGERICVALLYV